MAQSIGRIDLDLGINSSGFKSQMRGLTKTAKSSVGSMSGMFGKLGGAITAALSVAAVTKFAKACISLGSDLSEVQNVVDVTFGSMSSAVNKWAKDAMTAYGLSEKVAKDYMGQFGAMSKAFGNTEQMAYDQAAALTGLAGDVASFYNMTTDEAFTKLKSVYTGETESLKSLGVVMTQAALDEYALANGFGKTTKAMSEQEKVALRLSFVQNRLSGAAGDFARTSDSWANQTKVLSLRFDALKASIGQGLINVFTPVLKLINQLVAKLQVAADAFRSFTEAIIGNAGGPSTASVMSDASADMAANVDSAADSAKAIKKSLAGFDQINVLSSSQSDTAGGDTGASSTMPGSGASGAEEAANSAVSALDTLKRKLEEIANWTGLNRLWAGIKAGIAAINFNAIKTNFQTAFNGLQPIASAALAGIQPILQSFMNNLGVWTGGTIALTGKNVEIATGGLATFLETESSTISAWITETATKIATGYDNLAFAGETIFGSLWAALDENQVHIEASIANMLTAYSDSFMTIGTTLTNIWGEWTAGFATFADENSAGITNMFGSMIGAATSACDAVAAAMSGLASIGAKLLDTVSGGILSFLEAESSTILSWATDMATTLGTSFDDLAFSAETIFGTLWEALDLNQTEIENSIANILTAFSTAGMTIGTVFVDLWAGLTAGIADFFEENRSSITSALDGIIGVCTSACDFVSGIIHDVFASVRDWWEADGKRILDEVISVLQDVGAWVLDIWNTWIMPVLDYAMAALNELWTGTLKPLWDKCLALLTSLWDAIKAVWDAVLKPVVDWLIDTLGPIFISVWETVIDVGKKVFEEIGNWVGGVIDYFKGLLDFITGVFTGDWDKAWQGIKDMFAGAWDSLVAIFEGTVGTLGVLFEGIGETASAVWKNIETACSACWEWICGVFSGAGNWWQTNVSGPISNKMSNVWGSLRSGAGNAWAGIKSTFSGVGNWFKDTFSKAWEKVKDVFSSGGEVFSGIKDGIADTFKTVVNKLIDGINTIIATPFNKINDMLNTIRDISILGATPFKGLWSKNPLSVPKIPKLASGGYVAANTPQLAVIGDNKHEGEIVAPESKIAEAVAAGFAMVMSKFQQSTSSNNQPMYLTLKLGEDTFWQGFIDYHNSIVKRTGDTPLLV